MKNYLLLTSLSLLTACGQIGPLYLPDDPNPPVHVPKAEPTEKKTTDTESEKN